MAVALCGQYLLRMVAVLVISLIALNLAFRIGMRYNQRMVRDVQIALEQRFRPTETAWTPAGAGVGWGFELATDGDVSAVTGVLTTLPRYQLLYLPIALLLGRGDLLKLVFHIPDAMPPGVGTVVRDSVRGSRWYAVQRDADWHEEQVQDGLERFRLFFFNPLVAGRLRSLLPRLGCITGLHQVSLDSRSGTVTAFIRPDRRTIVEDLERVEALIFSLTAPQTRVTVS